MALRVWSPIRCASWMPPSLLFLLLFLALSAMIISTLPLLPPETTQRLPSRGLSSAGGSERAGGFGGPPSLPALRPRVHSGGWRQGDGGDSSKHLLMLVDPPANPERRRAAGGIADIHDAAHTDGLKRSAARKTSGTASERKHAPEPSQQVKNKHRALQPITGGDMPRQAGKLTNRSAAAELLSQPGWVGAAVDPRLVENKLTPDGQRYAKHAGKVSEGHQETQKASGDLKNRALYKSLDKKKHKENRPESDTHTAELKDGDWCESVGGETASSFPDEDRRRLRTGAHPVPWLSQDDLQKMELLSGADVVSKARVPAHGQVLLVALGSAAQGGAAGAEPHTRLCQQGRCALIKRPDDWFEVFAFHLDRVLGLNRSLPTVLRTFQSDILPYRYTRGTSRPTIWWDPDIQHLADRNNDQNSFPLTWTQYQSLLLARCGKGENLDSTPCVGVHHPEWGRLALFDFLLQVNDRLDRYCCGFRPDPSELCVENLLHDKCGNPKDLVLVHILVRKMDPSRLVFIDNAGRPHHPSDNLNFRLVEGIDEFPGRAVSVLKSGCLERMLLRSLYMDREFWDSRGGLSGLQPLVRTVAQRGRILLQHIHDKKLRLNRDL